MCSRNDHGGQATADGPYSDGGGSGVHKSTWLTDYNCKSGDAGGLPGYVLVTQGLHDILYAVLYRLCTRLFIEFAKLRKLVAQR